MPTLIKPRTLGALTKVERRNSGVSFIVTAFGLFDLARSEADRFETDQTMWAMTAKALPKGSALDLGMPKPRAEILIGGAAQAPAGDPVPAMLLEWQVGTLGKRLAVMGDRYWQIGGAGFVQTQPKAFREMPLDPERAFGGPGHPDNPRGVGFKAADQIRARMPAALPNIEWADRMIRTIDQTPAPALCGPMDLTSPKRRRFAGTYDAHWTKHNAPGLPDDVDPRLFLLAPDDQQFPGFLGGGEAYALRGFCKDNAELRGNLPDFRVRAFLARAAAGDETPAQLVEVAMRIDTLWLFAGARRGVLVYRGAAPIQDIDAEDISHVMFAYERGRESPRSFNHYRDVWQLRADREQAYKFAFAESQIAPALSPETIDRRCSERLVSQQARLDRHAAGQRWMIERQMRQSGVPEALWPAMPAHEPDPDLAAFPMPTAEELEEGEVDLAAILDAIEALQNKVAGAADAAKAKSAPLIEAISGLQAPNAGPESVDALLAALEGLGAEIPLGQIDGTLGGLQMPDFPLEADPKVAAEATAQVAGLTDWRGLLLDAAKGPVIDEEAEFAGAHGRFLDLPDYRPLADARKAMAQARIDVPELPAIEPPPEASTPARAEPEGGALLALLDRLDSEPNVPKAATAEIRGKLDETEATLRAALPNLPKSGSAIAAMLEIATQMAGDSEPPSSDPKVALAAALGRRDQILDDATAKLDGQEAQIVAALARSRRMAPIASYPKRPLLGSVARRFGDAILAAHRSGRSLRGRDMAGADLRGADLRGADLEGALVEQADLSGACLAGGRLIDAALTAATLDEADLSDADLSGANFAKCRARGADFSRTVWNGSLLLETDLAGAGFRGASWTGIRAIKANLEATAFEAARLEQCVFMESAFDQSNWDGATLSQTQWLEITMQGASFREARLTRCSFLRLHAPECDFSGADISRCAFFGETDLSNSSFRGATGQSSGFTKAKLSGGDFASSRFDGSNFGAVDLSGAGLSLASFKKSLFGGADLTGADLVGANLFGAQMRRAMFGGAQLRGANLYGALLHDADFVGADLTGANLAKTMFEVDTHAG